MIVSSASGHTKAIDVQLNATMRTVSGNLKSTKTEWLPILSNIAPPAIQRDVLSSQYCSHIWDPEIPAVRLLVEHLRCLLKSRKPPWNRAELLIGGYQSEADLWRVSWEAATAPNKHIVHDSAIAPPGFTLPHRQWTLGSSQQAPHWTGLLQQHPPPMEDEAGCAVWLQRSPDDGAHHVALSLAAAIGRPFSPPPTHP